MAKDENLQLLGATPPPHQPHQREQVPDNEIDERPEQAALLDHGNRAPNLASPARQRAANEFANPTRSNRAIAKQLYLGPRAVERHVQGIFQKLDLPESDDHNRRVLAVLALLGR